MFSTQERKRRTAAGVGTELAAPRCDSMRNCGVELRKRVGEICRRRGQGGYGRKNCDCISGIERAMRWRGEAWLVGCGLQHLCHCGVGHGAMVRSVAAAAGRQTRIAAGVEGGRKRPQPEEENEEDGERTPHLAFILHE